uniref:phosphatidylglycerophosphatase n=1 Tax=Kalanchoe fedtschenkoi TaxID=63787 RepID=A0A7N0VI18_KALFE
MLIEELDDREVQKWDANGTAVTTDAKRVLVGAGARALFYPTLIYNVIRNKLQTEFRWWDRVDKFVLLGAVPFSTDVFRLKELGVQGVITLNEPYETLVPSSLYLANGIDHLLIPTRDYCFAPSLRDICQAVNFIHEKASLGQTTYVHCKAGRGRSTTIVLCYLVKHRGMTPDAAYAYVKSIRPRVRLASAQWQAVVQYYYLKVEMARVVYAHMTEIPKTIIPRPSEDKEVVAFDDSSVVVVSDADLDGYDSTLIRSTAGSELWTTDVNVIYKVRVASQAALTRVSCLWLRCRTTQKNVSKLGAESSCSVQADQLGSISVDIHVY